MSSSQKPKNHLNDTGTSLKAEWRSWYAGKSPVFQFGLKFGALMVLLYALLATTFFDRLLYSYLEANAWIANFILNGLGQHSHVTEVTISSPQFNMAIRRGCDAVEPTWLFCAAVVSFPATLRHKLLGVLAGIVVLQVLNLARIVTLYWIGIHLPGLFNSAHLEIWPTLFILTAILLFIAWRGWSSDQEAPHVA
jgi:exosortase H (IPTLxxWG-CTERM-specific)